MADATVPPCPRSRNLASCRHPHVALRGWQSMRCTLAVLLLAGSLLSLAYAAAPPPAVSPEVFKLIDQLGDDDDDVRKAAMHKLEAIGPLALGPLRQASNKHLDAD